LSVIYRPFKQLLVERLTGLYVELKMAGLEPIPNARIPERCNLTIKIPEELEGADGHDFEPAFFGSQIKRN
jgi:hypothetical protein